MARSSDTDDSGSPDDAAPRMSLWQRLRYSIVVPDSDPGTKEVAYDKSEEELSAEIKTASDKERAFGLIAGPVAAAIGFLIIDAQISHDPAQYLSSGKLNAAYVSVSLYNELLGVLIFLSVLMLVTALLRKRLFLGLSMALYGLAIFNLHYWGFGVPFVMAGAYLLVRAYRLQQALRRVTGSPGSGSGGRGGAGARSGPRPRANKRYTPPT
jgi:hypothetical protein